MKLSGLKDDKDPTKAQFNKTFVKDIFIRSAVNWEEAWKTGDDSKKKWKELRQGDIGDVVTYQADDKVTPLREAILSYFYAKVKKTNPSMWGKLARTAGMVASFGVSEILINDPMSPWDYVPGIALMQGLGKEAAGVFKDANAELRKRIEKQQNAKARKSQATVLKQFSMSPKGKLFAPLLPDGKKNPYADIEGDGKPDMSLKNLRVITRLGSNFGGFAGGLDADFNPPSAIVAAATQKKTREALSYVWKNLLQKGEKHDESLLKPIFEFELSEYSFMTIFRLTLYFMGLLQKSGDGTPFKNIPADLAWGNTTGQVAEGKQTNTFLLVLSLVRSTIKTSKTVQEQADKLKKAQQPKQAGKQVKAVDMASSMGQIHKNMQCLLISFADQFEGKHESLSAKLIKKYPFFRISGDCDHIHNYFSFKPHVTEKLVNASSQTINQLVPTFELFKERHRDLQSGARLKSPVYRKVLYIPDRTQQSPSPHPLTPGMTEVNIKAEGGDKDFDTNSFRDVTIKFVFPDLQSMFLNFQNISKDAKGKPIVKYPYGRSKAAKNTPDNEMPSSFAELIFPQDTPSDDAISTLLGIGDGGLGNYTIVLRIGYDASLGNTREWDAYGKLMKKNIGIFDTEKSEPLYRDLYLTPHDTEISFTEQGTFEVVAHYNGRHVLVNKHDGNKLFPAIKQTLAVIEKEPSVGKQITKTKNAMKKVKKKGAKASPKSKASYKSELEKLKVTVDAQKGFQFHTFLSDQLSKLLKTTIAGDHVFQISVNAHALGLKAKGAPTVTKWNPSVSREDRHLISLGSGAIQKVDAKQTGADKAIKEIKDGGKKKKEKIDPAKMKVMQEGATAAQGADQAAADEKKSRSGKAVENRAKAAAEKAKFKEIDFDEDEWPITFIYLGDLIAEIMLWRYSERDKALKNEAVQKMANKHAAYVASLIAAATKGATGKTKVPKKKTKVPKKKGTKVSKPKQKKELLREINFMLGTFKLPILKGDKLTFHNINLADIPIEINFIKNFITETLIRVAAYEITLAAFLIKLIKDLFLEYFNSSCLPEPQNVLRKKGTFHFFEKQTLDKKSGSVNKGTGGIWNLSERGQAKTIVQFKNRMQEIEKKLNNPSFKASPPPAYSYCYLGTNNTSGGSYDFKKDLQSNIQWFSVGNNTGLLKRAEFVSEEMEHLTTDLILEQTTGAGAHFFIPRVFNVNLTLIGNTLFEPGMTLFVYPGVLAGIMDPPKAAIHVIKQTGLGGYYYVTNVATTIDPTGKFETVLECIKTGKGAGEAKKSFTKAPAKRVKTKTVTSSRRRSLTPDALKGVAAMATKTGK